jgi:AhpC/TSA family
MEADARSAVVSRVTPALGMLRAWTSGAAAPQKGRNMSLTINDTAPDFTAQTTEGELSFHDWIGDSWAVLFSHPKDFTPVCTTELGYMAKIKSEFDRRNVKIIGISVDSTGDHEGWAKDIEETQGYAPTTISRSRSCTGCFPPRSVGRPLIEPLRTTRRCATSSSSARTRRSSSSSSIR